MNVTFLKSIIEFTTSCLGTTVERCFIFSQLPSTLKKIVTKQSLLVCYLQRFCMSCDLLLKDKFESLTHGTYCNATLRSFYSQQRVSFPREKQMYVTLVLA